MIFLQLKTAYPEDMFLIPSIWVALIIFGLGILLSLVFGFRKPSKVKVKNSQNNVVTCKPEYFIEIGVHEIPIDKSEVTRAKREGYKVVEI